MSKPRNLKVDLETCNRASKAPWRVATNKHPTTRGNSWGWVEGPRENWCWSNDNKKSYADAKFIAQAREGWPHAIERALEAEAKLEKAKDLIQRWFDGEIGAFGVMDALIIDLEFDIDGIPDEALEYHNIKRKEVLVDEA